MIILSFLCDLPKLKTTAIAAEAFNNLVRGGGTEHTGGETSMDKDLHRNPTYDVDVEEAHDI